MSHIYNSFDQQRAYAGLQSARRLSGMARIGMGLHLCILKDSNGWVGRSGAQSFRRFLIDEGLQPASTYGYMKVARAFVLEHGIEPIKLCSISMRVLLRAADLVLVNTWSKEEISDLMDIMISLPPAEAQTQISDRFNYKLDGTSQEKVLRSRAVSSILASVEGLNLEERAILYSKLHVTNPLGLTPERAIQSLRLNSRVFSCQSE